MKKIFRIFSAVAILVMLVGSSPPALLKAQGEQVVVSIDAPAIVEASSNFTATVNITMVQNLNAGNYDVLFDPAVLRLDNVADGNIGGTVVPVDIWNPFAPGAVAIVQNISGLTGVNGTGYLAQLWFSVVGSPGQSSNITLSNGTLSDNSAQRIPAAWLEDMVAVSGGSILQAITVMPANPVIPVGGNLPFQAIGTYADNTTANLTAAVAWSSSNTTVATIMPYGGIAHGWAEGTTMISATLGEISGSTTLTVNASPTQLVAIMVMPFNPVIPVGGSLPFEAIGLYTNNTTANVTSAVAWSSSNTTVATIMPYGGIAHGWAEGTTMISATLGEINGATILTVGTAPPQLVSIIVVPENPVIPIGSSLPFQAIGTHADNTTANLTGMVTWSSSNTTVATIMPYGGIAQGLATGLTQITATLGPLSDSTMLTVVPPSPGGVTVSIDAPEIVQPASAFTATVNITQVQDLDAGNYDVSFDPLVLRLDNVTDGIVPVDVWHIYEPATGTAVIVQNVPGIDGYYGSGSLATLWFSVIGAPGTSSNITLSDGTLSNTSAQRIPATWVGDKVQIASGVLQTITVVPDNQSLPLGRTLPFDAIGRYSNNATANLTASVIWSSNNTTVATISTTGLAQGRATGQARITATLGEISGSANLTVIAKVLDEITVTPANQSIALGRSLPYTAMGRYSDNSTASLTASVVWTSSNPTVATIAGGGHAQSLAVGQTRITATLGAISGFTDLNVTAKVLDAVTVTPDSPAIVAGTSLPLTLMGVYSDNTTQDLTASASWSSSNTTVASIGLHTGIAQGLAVGQTTITATLSALSDTTILTVTTLIPPTVITNNATDITIDAATLRGRLGNLGDYTSALVSFEWGTTSGELYQTTTAQTLTTAGDFSAALSGLPQDTPHYFRAKAEANGLTVYGSELSFTTKAIVVWTVPMQATTPGSGSNPNLAFGTKVAATDGFDDGIDIPHSPPAPGAKYDVYFPSDNIIFNQLDQDFRAPGDNVMWQLSISLMGQTMTENITLSWNANQIPAELSAYMNTGTAVVDMKAQNTLALSPGSYNIVITVSKDVSVQISLKAGWNMVSLPVVPANPYYKSVFPTALVAYSWNPATKSYAPVTNLEAGKGYWVAVSADAVATVVGSPVLSWTKSITAGWNMIGSVNAVVGISNPEDTPDNSVQKFTYWWNPATKSYLYGFGTQAIEAGKGYWVAATASGSLTLSTTSK